MTRSGRVAWRTAGAVAVTLALVTISSTPAVGGGASAGGGGVAGAGAGSGSGSGAGVGVGSALPAESRQPAARSWAWPIAPPWRVTKAFRAPATRFSVGHRGIDLNARPGDVVLAPADGVVSFVGRVVDRQVTSLVHAGDLQASFEPVESFLVEGQEVRKGERIGIVGAGGHCDGTCLHFSVRLRGEYVSPMLYLGGVPRAVLLPLR